MDYIPQVPVEIRDKEWWDVIKCPSIMEDQYFGFELEEQHFQNADVLFKEDLKISEKPNRMQFLPSEAKLLTVDTGYSKVMNTDKEFEVNLTIKPFKLDDIKVSFVQGMLAIRCEHSITQQGKGQVSRSFERNYVLPKKCDKSSLKSYVTPDDVLIVKCQKTEEFAEQRVEVEKL